MMEIAPYRKVQAATNVSCSRCPNSGVALRLKALTAKKLELEIGTLPAFTRIAKYPENRQTVRRY
jgi:hypothetical protein